MKMNYQKFVRTQMWVTRKDGDKTINAKLPLRFNPFHISSYGGCAFIGDSGEHVQCTRAFIGSTSYLVDMTVEEFDEMMDNIETGLILEE